jgi:hypothetical protein
MVTRKLAFVALVGAMVVAMSVKSHAQCYLENFNSNTDIANFTDWIIGSEDGGGAATITQVIGEKMADVVNVGPGDNAILIGTNATNTFNDQIRIQLDAVQIVRGNSTQVEAVYWGDTATT